MSARRAILGVALLAGLAACDLPPEGISPEMIANYDSAVTSLGCEIVSDGDYLAVELQAGLTRDQALSISEFKLAREEAVRLENGGLRLTTGTCAA